MESKMKNYLIRLIMYSAIAIVPIGCGTRKVNLNEQSLKTVDSSKSNVDQSKDVSQVISTQEEAFNKINKSNKTNETTTTNKYDKYTGKLIESSVSTKTGYKLEDRQSYINTITNNSLRTIEKLKTQTITKHEKQIIYRTKLVEVSNAKFYWVIFGLGIALIVAVFLYFKK